MIKSLIPENKLFTGVMREQIGMFKSQGVVLENDSKTGTAYDDPDFNPWDSVAAELIKGDTGAVEKAAEETRKYIKLKRPEVLRREKETKARRARLDKILTAMDEMTNWMVNADSFYMQKIEGPGWHRLKQAVSDGRAFTASTEGDENLYPNLLPYATLTDDPQIFLMQYDWATVVASAGDANGNALDTTEYRLPFPVCCFEAQLGGHRMLTIMRTAEGDRIKFVIAIEFRDMWYVGAECDLIEFMKDFNAELAEKHIKKQNYILDNIAAMCICLDAEVLVTEVVRAPHKLNAARIKQGKTPVNDHHVVSLARRHRIGNPMEHVSDGSRIGTVRGHWRRGHWRHYADHKTWIKFQLVGNLDLGFISKEYKA